NSSPACTPSRAFSHSSGANPPMSNASPVSIVILTKDEAANIAECLDAICAQVASGDEVLVLDSASRDDTVARARSVSGPVRIHDCVPEAFASTVNAAYRRLAFRALRFDENASGAEDVAFARAARLAGLRLAYAPDAVVRHKDVTTLRSEWRKLAREGRAYAQL